MLGVPARIAGCTTRILCSPVQATGRVDAAVLYAARVAGVQRVFKLGGAQAIAAMAYGTESVPKVDKIFGPGNTWVTEAKAQVDRDPAGAARDYPAGRPRCSSSPTTSANAAFVAADLLSQAEHGADSQVLLVTTSAKLAARRHGGRSPRRRRGSSAASSSTARSRTRAHRRRRPRDGIRDLEPLRAGAPDPPDRASRARG